MSGAGRGGTREARPQRGSGPQPAATVAGTKNLPTDPEHPLAPERLWAFYELAQRTSGCLEDPRRVLFIVLVACAPPTCVGEASAEEDRRVENKRYSNGLERCACYATAQLREGNGAHAPSAHPTRVKRKPKKTGGSRISAIQTGTCAVRATRQRD